MLEIFHNPRCRKSREGLEILKNSGKEFTIREYLKNPPQSSELKEILDKMGWTAEQLVRKNEPIWKENYKGKTLTETAFLTALSKHPKLIERPILISDKAAVVGRPPELLEAFLENA